MGLRAGNSTGGVLNGSMHSSNNRDVALITGFTTLRSQLDEVDNIKTFDALAILAPFLDVIRSGETTGPITAVALASVERFLTYELISPESANIINAVAQLSSASTHCKFEPSDSVSDEVVLLRILQVLRIIVCGDLGAFLTDEAICEMMETGLSMCYQMRLSEMLRRSAEITMTSMVHAVFHRLKTINPDSWQPHQGSLPLEGLVDVTGEEKVRMQRPDPRQAGVPSASTQDDPSVTIASPKSPKFPTNEQEEADNSTDEKTAEATDEPAELSTPQPVDPAETFLPYGLPAIRELLRVLISLIDPHDHQHTDTMRFMALRIINVALETSGRTIGLYHPLRQLAVDDLCRHLFQLARSDNTQILSSSLRVISTLFNTLRPYLKLQQELFLSYLIRRISPSSLLDPVTHGEGVGKIDSPAGTPSRSNTPVPKRGADAIPVTGETRILLVEVLSQLAKSPSFMIDLWVNYDCDVHCSDLFEEMLRFLTKNAFPEYNGQPFSSFNMLCLDAMLTFISHMSGRLDRVEDAKVLTQAPAFSDMTADDYNAGVRPKEYPTPEELLRLKTQKKLLLEAASKFNDKPKVGLAFLEENGIIAQQDGPDGPRSLARVLKLTPRIDKRLLGDYISRPQNIEVLKAFIDLFDFGDKRLDEAMRELFETFRLPGEAQQIARIIETFAEKFASTSSDVVTTPDACYVLAYSVVMLNTDQHNPQVRKRMKIEEYMRNLRGVNDGQDFPPEYLQAIYDNIQKREIVMPEEHEGQLGFNYAWKELLKRSETAGTLVVCDTHIYDKDIFASSWKPTLQASSQAFALFQDDQMLQRAIAGFHQCALLAAHYKLHEVFDFITVSLADITGLTDAKYARETASFPTADIDGQKVVVSELTVNFGRNYKGQLAAVVLFKVVNEYASVLRQSWTQVLEILRNLFVHSMLPESLLQVEDYLSGTSTIPLKPKVTALPKQERGRESGLLSTLSSYLLSPYSGSSDNLRADPTPEEIESTMCTVDCIAACHVDELYAELRDLDAASLQAFVSTVKSLADAHTLEKLREKKQKPSGPHRAALPYDPSSVFFLELMVGVLQQRKESAEELWSTVFDHISGVLENSESFSELLVERSVVALLRMCNLIVENPKLLDQVFLSLDLIRSLPVDVMNAVAEQMMAGFTSLMARLPAYIKTSTEWQMILAILGKTAHHPTASKYSFDISKSIVSGQYGTRVIIDTFAPCVDLLSTFASSGKVDGFPQSEQQGSSHQNAKVTPENAQRATEAIGLISSLHAKVKVFATEYNLSATVLWEKYWLPILTALRAQSVNPSREIRNQALTSLQRTLLSPDLMSNDGEAAESVAIFEKVLFPLLDELLKPEVFQLDPTGMDETRMKASALLCKVYLQYLMQLSEWSGMVDLWGKILQYLDRFMHSGKRDNVYESVPESLKNVLLVMSSSGYLFDPVVAEQEGQTLTSQQVELWKVTWEKLDVLLPNLKGELFPPMPPRQASPQAPPPTQSETAEEKETPMPAAQEV